MEVDLLVNPVRHRIAVQEVLQERQRHDQRHQPLPVVLDQAWKLLLVLARQVVLEEAYQVLEDVMLRAIGLHLLLGGIQRFSTIGHPIALATCYVAPWWLPRPFTGQLLTAFRTHHALVSPRYSFSLAKTFFKPAEISGPVTLQWS
jgi:hypothetical protein